MIFTQKIFKQFFLVLTILLLCANINTFSQRKKDQDRDFANQTKLEKNTFENYFPTTPYNLTEKDISKFEKIDNLYKNFSSYKHPKRMRDVGIGMLAGGLTSLFAIGVPLAFFGGFAATNPNCGYVDEDDISMSSMNNCDNASDVPNAGLWESGIFFITTGTISTLIGPVLWAVGSTQIQRKNKAYYYQKLKNADE